MTTKPLRVYNAPRMTDEHILVTLYMSPARTAAGEAVRLAVITRIEMGIAIRAGLASGVAS
jgi:hypothetical protein